MFPIVSLTYCMLGPLSLIVTFRLTLEEKEAAFHLFFGCDVNLIYKRIYCQDDYH